MKTKPVAAVVGVLAVTTSLFAGAVPAQADPLVPKNTFTMTVDQASGLTQTPTDGAAIPNIDSVKSTIRAYYGATKSLNPVTGSGTIFMANLVNSRYADNLRSIEANVLGNLPKVAGADDAVVFDVDSTMLSDYGFEEATNFNYDPAVNAQWVHFGMPAVTGMPALVRELQQRGYAIYGITGRPWSQEDDTLQNLQDRNFTDDGTASGTPIFTTDNLFTKWDTSANPTGPTKPDYIGACTYSPNCNTVEYKANTRKHIETAVVDGGLGKNVVMNIGDQWSDLEGGYADHWTKIPNPTYFLAAHDIAGAPASDENMIPPTTYVMQPDGSSGYGVSSGDQIPNLDPLRKMIRAYYNAPISGPGAGVADKSASPYITQLAALQSSWQSQVTGNCQTQAAAVSTAQAAKAAANQKVTADTAAVTKAQAAVTAAKAAVIKARKALRHATTRKARIRARKHLNAALANLATAKAALAAAQAKLAADKAAAAAIVIPPAPAAVFDADDTTLWNYDLEDSVMHFAYDPAVSAAAVAAHAMPAVPGMVDFVKAVKASGCTLFTVTGRPKSQQADTEANLVEDGYTTDGGAPLFSGFYLKPNSGDPMPSFVDCSTDGDPSNCTTIDFKSGARSDIESKGYKVVGNFGDQFSDLIGGHSAYTYKVPNPTYYLP